MSIRDEFIAQFSCDPPEETPLEILENYHFMSLLSEKAGRRVFLLNNIETGEKAVLKAVTKDDPEDAAREYRILKALRHPSIPKALGYYEGEAEDYLLRSYAQGETLEFLMERDGKFSEKRSLEIILSLCEILGYLHSQSPPVIFRDIQPRNIVLTPNGRLSLIDFGISRDEARDSHGATVLAGTRYFAAPENYGFSADGPHTDIYALGCLLMWLCSGERDVKNCRDLGLTRPLCRIVEKCTQLNPRRRYKNTDTLKRHIHRIIQPPGRLEIALGLLVTALVVVGGIKLWYSPPIPANDSELHKQSPVRASGYEYEKEASFPVGVTVLMDGEPWSDAVVALDNRHWYYPADDGVATLWGYAYDHYMLKACWENRTAQKAVSVNRSMADEGFELDIALTPGQPEFFDAEVRAGEYSLLEFPSSGADTFMLQPGTEGIEAVFEDERIFLEVLPEVKAGHYSFFAEGSNSQGFAVTQVSILIEDDKEPVHIYDASGLSAMRENPGGSYILMNDIDLADIESWEPVGDADHPFTGALYGNGFTISGLRIDADGSAAGLFGFSENAVFSNVIILEPDIFLRCREYGNAGAIAAAANNCLFDSCAVFGGRIAAHMGNQSNIGGIAGYAGGVIRGCFNSAEIEAGPFEAGDSQNYVGGLCGVLLGSVTESGNTGSVKGSYTAGGLVGMNDNSVISRSYNAGSVDGALVTGIMPPGGISHIIRVGRYHSYCAYLSGTAMQATSVTTNGYPYAMSVMTFEEFMDSGVFCEKLDVEMGDFVWDSEVSDFPVPAGVF